MFPDSRRLCALTFIALIGLAAFLKAATAQDSTGVLANRLSKATETRIVGKIERMMQDKGVPGLSVAIGRDNQLVFSRGFGMADLENQVTASDQTKYRTASIAKSLTAVVILSLAEEGKLDLDSEVQKYCPAYPRKKWPVTVRQVMGHLGGVRHYKYPGESTSTEHFFTLDDALSTFSEDELLHEPGTKYRYSSFGYNLLGSVAEGAGKRDFMSLLGKRVLEPAGMGSTVADDTFVIISNRTRGYIRANSSLVRSLPKGHNIQVGKIYNSRLHDTSMKIPGGGLLSTAPDLVRFAIAVSRQQLLSKPWLDEMWSEQTTTTGKKTGYGLGWRVGKQLDRRAVWHTGGQSGTSTVLVLFPDSGTSIALMCNLQNTGLTGLAASLASDVFKEATPNQKRVTRQMPK